MDSQRHFRITRALAVIGLIATGAAHGILSYDAIRDTAVATGAVDESLAWLEPIALDGMALTAAAVLWIRPSWQARIAFAVPAALSVWANIAHAGNGTLLGQALAAVPPLGLYMSLELVAAQLRPREPAPVEPAQLKPTPVSLNKATENSGELEPAAVTAVAANGNGHFRKLEDLLPLVPDQHELDRLVAKHGSDSAVARELQTRRQTVGRLRKKLA